MRSSYSSSTAETSATSSSSSTSATSSSSSTSATVSLPPSPSSNGVAAAAAAAAVAHSPLQIVHHVHATVNEVTAIYCFGKQLLVAQVDGSLQVRSNEVSRLFYIFCTIEMNVLLNALADMPHICLLLLGCVRYRCFHRAFCNKDLRCVQQISLVCI